MLAQKAYITLKPSTGVFFGTYQTQVLETNNTTNLFEYQRSSLGDISLSHVSWGVEASLFKINKLIFGFSVFNSGAAYACGGMYFTTANLVEAPTGYTQNKELAYYSRTSNNILNYGINVTYEHRPGLHLSLGLLLQKDRTNIPGGYSADAVYMQDGLFYFLEYIDESFEDKNSAAVSLGLEKTFFSKKNKNLFSVNLSYLQGMRIMGYSRTSYMQEPLNYRMVMESISRASGFNLTISRTFKLYSK